MLPDKGRIEAIGAGDRRVTRPTRDNQIEVFLLNQEASTVKKVIPDELQSIPLLVLGLDQGSIGCAGHSFAEFLKAFIHVKWDKFHRVIRDVNLTFQHAASGVFLKAQEYSCYIWATNFRPSVSRFLTGLTVLRAISWRCILMARQDPEADLWACWLCVSQEAS